MAVPALDTVATLTFRAQEKEIVDAIYNSFTLLKKFKETGTFQSQLGGNTIDVPVRYVKDGTAQSFDGGDQVDISPVETISNASFPWKHLHVPVNILRTEVLKNMGKSAVGNLIQSKKDGAIEDGQDKMTTVFFGDGTGNGGKDPMGLKGIIAADPTTGTIGGINRASFSFWENKANKSLDTSINGTKSSTSTFAWADVGKRYMRNQMNNCAAGGMGKDRRPNCIITTQQLFEQICNTMDDKVRIPDKGMMDLGIESFLFMGVPVIWDAALSTETVNSVTGTSRMYFVNTKYMKIVYHPNANWEFFPFEKALDQYQSVASFQWSGNMVVRDSRRLGVVTGFTTSL